jgi:hypothetical protein
MDLHDRTSLTFGAAVAAAMVNDGMQVERITCEAASRRVSG